MNICIQEHYNCWRNSLQTQLSFKCDIHGIFVPGFTIRHESTCEHLYFNAYLMSIFWFICIRTKSMVCHFTNDIFYRCKVIYHSPKMSKNLFINKTSNIFWCINYMATLIAWCIYMHLEAITPFVPGYLHGLEGNVLGSRYAAYGIRGDRCVGWV